MLLSESHLLSSKDEKVLIEGTSKATRGRARLQLGLLNLLFWDCETPRPLNYLTFVTFAGKSNDSEPLQKGAIIPSPFPKGD
jgi:hypothetical protein